MAIIGLQAQIKPIYLDNSKPLEQRVEDALSRMTMEEKVELCHAQSTFSWQTWKAATRNPVESLRNE
jgi:beta-glucosidase